MPTQDTNPSSDSDNEDREMRFPLMRGDYLNPAILQLFGILLMAVFAVNYLFTYQASSLLIGASLVLIGLGSAGGALITVRQEIKETAQAHKERLSKISDEGASELATGDNGEAT